MNARSDPEAGFDQARSLQEFWDANYERLLRVFPEQFVAVDPATGDVLAANADLMLLVAALRARGINPVADAAIEFITTRSDSLIL